MLYTAIVILITLIALAAVGVVGYFAYRTGYDKGKKDTEHKYKKPELTPEQQDVKQKRERVEEHFNRLLTFSPTRK